MVPASVRRSSLTIALALLAHTADSYAQGPIPHPELSGFAATNGNKIVIKAKVLHAVYAEAGDVYYRRSLDGNPWSAPTKVNGTLTPCVEPVVSIDDESTVSVAFTCYSGPIPTVYYTFLAKGSALWAAPAQVEQHATQPTMASFGDRAHLAWSNYGFYIHYAEFASKAGPAGAAIEQVNTTVPACGDLESALPSITLTPPVTGQSGPNIFVSFLRHIDNSNCSPLPPVVALIALVVERRAAPSSWTEAHLVGGDETSPVHAFHSNSLASNQAGEVYAAASLAGSAGSSTFLAKLDDPSANTWIDHYYFSTATKIDIASNAKGKARIAYSEPTGPTQCGAVYRIELTWPKGSATPSTSGTGIAPSGRDPQALHFTRPLGCGRPKCGIEVAFRDCAASQIRTEVGCTPSTPPIIHYTFDDPAYQEYDDAGNGLDGDLAAAIPLQAGPVAGKLSIGFSGTNNVPEFTVPHDPSMNLAGAMTGFALIRPDGTHTADNNPTNCTRGTLFNKGGNYWFQVTQNNSGLLFQHDSSGSSQVLRTTPLVLSAWVLVAFVRDGSGNVSLFRNGQKVGTTGTLVGPPVLDTSRFEVGNFIDSRCEFQGLIDEIKIFDFDCTDAEVRAEYQASDIYVPEWRVPALSMFGLVGLAALLLGAGILKLLR